jgi:hypothetical protein
VSSPVNYSILCRGTPPAASYVSLKVQHQLKDSMMASVKPRYNLEEFARRGDTIRPLSRRESGGGGFLQGRAIYNAIHWGLTSSEIQSVTGRLKDSDRAKN